MKVTYSESETNQNKQSKKKDIKKIAKKVLSKSFKKYIIIIAIVVIVIVLLASIVKLIFHIDTAGEGSGDDKTKAVVPAAFQDVTQSVGVVTGAKTTSSSAGATSGNTNSKMIVSYDESGEGYSSVSKIGNKTYRNYKQYIGDYSSISYWGGNIQSDGCGPTSVCIVLTGYRLDYNPGQVVNRMKNEVANETNSINLSKLLNLYGIANERKSYSSFESILSDIRTNLSAERPVIVGIDGTSDGLYSTGGHWMVILGEKEGHIIVSNPGRPDENTPTDDTLENFIKTQMSIGNGYILISKELDTGNESSDETSNPNGTDKSINTEKISTQVNTSASQTSNSISKHIVSNGRGGYKIDIDLDKKIDEVIEKLDKEGNNPLNNYLSDKNRKEYLKEFLRASIVTCYPDLREKSEIGKPVPEGEVQGIIRIRRKTENTKEGEKGGYLEYIPEDDYNKLKQKNDYKEISGYFTIDSNGQIVVAGYEQRTVEPQKEDKGKDPRPDEIKNNAEEPMKTITDARINYIQQVEKYSMPFDLLWSLLVYSSDEDFTYELAKLVNNGQIEITVCDNITIKEKTDVYTYNKNVKIEEHATIEDITQTPPKAETKKYQENRPDEKYKYTITNKSTYTSNTPSIDITYADTWIMKYKADVEKAESKRTDTTENKEEDDKEFKEDGEEQLKESNSQFIGKWKKDYEDYLKQIYKQEIDSREKRINNQKEAKANAKTQVEKYLKEQLQTKNQTQTQTNNQTKTTVSEKDYNNAREVLSQEDLKSFEVMYRVSELKLKYFKKLTDKTRKITTVTTEKKYRVKPGKTEGKVDPKDKDGNFVKLLKEHDKAYGSLKSIKDWLFESMEAQESICDMVDLIKYLFQKTYNIDLGVDDFSFEEYGASTMSNVGNGNVVIAGNSIEEKVWNALVSAGFSEYAAAGAMGNINAESGFDPSLIEEGSGIGYGLCQWSFGRRTNYEAYAKSKGKPNSDLDTQIEFMLGDLGVEGYVTEYNENIAGMSGYYSDASFDGWKNAKSVRDAVYNYCWTYERPSPAYAHMDWRYESGEKYYNQFHGKTPTVSSSNTLPSSVTGTAKKILEAAQSKLGCPYVWGAEGPNQFDCGGFTKWCYAQAGISISHASQVNDAKEVIDGISNARPGDILYRPSTATMCGHVGLCVSNQNGVIKYIHAPQTGDVVKYSTTSEGNSTFTKVLRFF